MFQKTLLNQHHKQLDSDALNRAYDRFTACFHNADKQANIRASKEEQYQEGFLRDLFVDVFGYTLNPEPNYDLTTEFKNQAGAKKADGAILKDDSAIAVIELKGMDTTDLGRVEAQAFGYKNNQPQCRYVITSNFQKLRFYIDNAVEFIEFDLFTLSQSDFATLYTLLHRDSLFADVPKTLKNASLSQEESVTKQLYKDYADFKRALFADLTANNPDIDALELFKKSQKLLDRLLFIFFAEDSGLLPANFARNIIVEWDKLKDLNAEQPLYQRFKQYFNHLNTGYKNRNTDIFAYNGGLFAPDAILDAVTISDEVLEPHIKTLADYDFASEVDVNILGHIFENSLGEIDEIKAQLAGTPLDKAQTKRKKDGVFYTPKYITKYIVEQTVGKLCADKKAELGMVDEAYQKPARMTEKAKEAVAKNAEKLTVYRDWLLQITICDPACGSGAFLNEALSFLIAEHAYIDELESKLYGDSLVFKEVENHILENNLFGVDINEESVEIAKLSLWLRTAKPKRKLNRLSNNIKCGNSLIDDPEVAGDKAFNWAREFPQVFGYEDETVPPPLGEGTSSSGFDVIIGNPPYLRIQGLQDAYPELVKYYEDHFQSATGNYDIYVLFMERVLDLINAQGEISLILPHKFLISEFGEGIRELLADNQLVSSLLHFEEHLVFEVTTYTCIVNLNRKKKSALNFNFIDPILLQEPFDWQTMSYDNLSADKWNLLSDVQMDLFEKLHAQPLTAGKVFERIFVGLQTSSDKILLLEGKQEGDFIKGFSKSLDKVVEIEIGLAKPMLKGQDVSRYSSLENENYVIFPYEINEKGIAVAMTEDDISKNFPQGYQYLKENERELRSREKGKFDKENEWYLFGRKQGISEVEIPKIMTAEIANRPSMTFDTGVMYHATTVYSFVLKEPSDLAYKFYLSVLNSQVLWFYLANTGTVLRGGYFRFKTKYLQPFPLPELPENAQDYADKADQMLTLNADLQAVSQKFLRMLAREFDITAPNKKLQSWYTLDDKAFFAELEKDRKKAFKANNGTTTGYQKLSLGDKADWEDYFLAEKTKAEALTAQINATDRDIDNRVYALYGLSDEEIALVERG